MMQQTDRAACPSANSGNAFCKVKHAHRVLAIHNSGIHSTQQLMHATANAKAGSRRALLAKLSFHQPNQSAREGKTI